jgi:hypothetical protein
MSLGWVVERVGEALKFATVSFVIGRDVGQRFW